MELCSPEIQVVPYHKQQQYHTSHGVISQLKKSLHPKKEVKTRFFFPISKPKDGVNAEERHTFLSMQVPSSCCTFFQHSVLFSLWSIHCSGLFCFFSSYVGSGLAMAISKDINEQRPALSSLSRNPDVLASQGKVSGKRVEIYN